MANKRKAKAAAADSSLDKVTDWQPGPGAPPPPAHNGTAYWIKPTARQDGSFTVLNARNGFSKTYKSGI